VVLRKWRTEQFLMRAKAVFVCPVFGAFVIRRQVCCICVLLLGFILREASTRWRVTHIIPSRYGDTCLIYNVKIGWRDSSRDDGSLSIQVTLTLQSLR
jgi:hypothetical protein